MRGSSPIRALTVPLPAMPPPAPQRGPPRRALIPRPARAYIDAIDEINEYWSKKGALGSDMETAALLTVGRLRGMKCASVLNNVVRWKECISHGVGSYAAGADAAAAGEEHSILAALETFARLEAEKK